MKVVRSCLHAVQSMRSAYVLLRMLAVTRALETAV
jgi:hypothetical protein